LPRSPSRGQFVPILRSVHTPPVLDQSPSFPHSLSLLDQDQSLEPGTGKPTLPDYSEFKYFDNLVPFDPALNHWTPLANTSHQLPHQYDTPVVPSASNPGQQDWNCRYLKYGHYNSPLPPTLHQHDQYGDLLPRRHQHAAYNHIENLFFPPTNNSSHRQGSLAKRLSPRQLRRYGHSLLA